MADFDGIYALQDEEIQISGIPIILPEPIVIKGAGNLTVFGLSNRFDEEFPQSLSAKVAPEEFHATISRINSMLQKTLPVNMKWLLCGFLCCCCTFGCSLWPVVCLNKRTQATIEKMLQWENCQLYHKLGLHWRLGQQRCHASNLVEYVLYLDLLPRDAMLHPD